MNLTRITGMYSGFDTDQLVKDLIKAESIKVDKIKQDKIYTEWQQEAYRDIINEIRAFKDEYFSYTKPETNFRSTSSFVGYEANMKDESNNYYLDVGVTSASVTGNYTITDITLSESAIKQGNNTFLLGNSDLDKTLEELGYVDGVEFTIEATNAAGETKSDTIALTKDKKLRDVLSEVNSRDLDVEMYYDEIKNSVIIKTDDTGSTASLSNIKDTGGAGDLIADLGLVIDKGIDAPITGVDAKVKITDDSGASKEVSSSNNSVTVNGVTLDLKQNLTGGNIEFSVSSNADGIVDNIKGFVNKYNELIEKINTELTEKKYRDFKPLTEDQKKELTEDEVKKWEEKAKSGLLKNDSILGSMLRNMRSILYDSVDGMALYDIGITTSSDYKDKGKLIIDEEKLKKAIQDKPNQVANLFSKEDEGLANKLYDVIEDNISTRTDSYGRKGLLLEKAGIEGDRTAEDNLLSDKIKGYEDRITELLQDLNDKENYYYTMFAKMEKALAKMNSQSSFFMGQM
jgi:flagellar hook-associated protein 2